jgi:fibronectin-binding autotransporter adhesin
MSIFGESVFALNFPSLRSPASGVRRFRDISLPLLIALLLAMGLFGVPGLAWAATDTWTGNDSANWSDPLNWTGGNAPPLAGDSLIFSGTQQLNPNDNLASGLLIDGITFGSGAGAFSLEPSSNSITFGTSTDTGGGTFSGGAITDSANANETIGLGITLSAGNHTISTANGAGQLNLSGPITVSPDASVAFTVGGGNINLTGSGLANDATGILGGWAAIGLGNNTGGWAALNGSGNVVPYTGYQTFSGGIDLSATPGATAGQNVEITSRSSTHNSLGGTPGTTAPTTGTYDMNTLLWNAGTSNPSGSQNVDVDTGQILRFGADGGIMTVYSSANETFELTDTSGSTRGSVTAGGAPNTNGQLNLIDAPFSAGNQNLEIADPIINNGSGVVSVNTVGFVEINSTSNSYSGGTFVSDGRVQSNGPGALGSGTVTVNAGGEVYLESSGTWSNNFVLYGSGYGNGEGTIRMNNGAAISGSITLESTALFGPGNGNAGNSASLSGLISGLGGLTTGAGQGYVSGTLVFNETTPNTYAGNTTIDAASSNSVNGISIGPVGTPGTSNIMPNGPGTGNLILIGGSSAAATFDLNGTTQNINGLSATTGTLTNAIVQSSVSGGLLVVGNNNANATFGGVLQDGGGNLSLTKVGTGRQTLGGANTYSGTTTINNGILSITGSLNGSGAVNISGGTLSGTGAVTGAVTLASGAIDPGPTGPGSVGTLILNGGLAVNGGDLNFDLGSPNDLLMVNGSGVDFATASSLTPSSGTPGSTYTIISGSMSGTAIPSLVEPTTARVSYTYDPSSYNGINGASSIVLDVSGQTANLTWDNAGLSGDGQTWDVVGNKNWTSSATIGNPNEFYQGDNVTFNDSNNNHYNVIINGTVNPGSTTVNTNGAYVFSGSGSIGGIGALSLSGNGSLTLGTSNSFSGGTTLTSGTINANSATALGSGPIIVNAGTLNINNASALGVGALTINGGTLDNTTASAIAVSTDNPQIWGASFTFNGTQSLGLGGGAVTLNSNPTITVNNNTLTVGGIIGNGSGDSLTKAGNGTLVLTSDSNTFSGGLTINGGAVNVYGSNGASALGSGDMTVNAGATLVGAVGDSFGYTGGESPATIYINGGTITDLGTASYRITLQDIHFTAGGVLTNASGNNGDTNGNYSLYYGTVESDAASTTAVINAGVISLQNGTTTFTVAPGNVTSGPTPGVDMLVSSLIKNFNSAFGYVILQGGGVLALDNANSTYGGGTTVSAGTLQLGTSNDTSSLNTPAGSGPVTDNALINFASSQPMTFNNSISGSGAVTVSSSTVTLAGSNGYAGTTTVANGATLVIPNGGALPTNGVVVNNGTLAITSAGISGFSASIASLTGTGSLNLGDGVNSYALALTGTNVVNTQGSLTINGGQTVGSTLDIGQNALVISDGGNAATAEAQIQQYVENGMNGSATGGSIISSYAASNGLDVAYADAGDTNLAGSKLATDNPGDIVIEPALPGDTDLNGVVNIHDLTNLLSNFNSPGFWDQGNFNGHANVDISDLSALLSNFNTSVTLSYAELNEIENLVGQFGFDAIPNSNGNGFTLVSVPEPASVGLIAAAGFGLLARRRRK